MDQLYKDKLKSRVKSFLWRLAGMVGVAALNFLVTNAGLLNLSPTVVTILGLAAGEVTKYFRMNVPEIKKLRANNK